MSLAVARADSMSHQIMQLSRVLAVALPVSEASRTSFGSALKKSQTPFCSDRTMVSDIVINSASAVEYDLTVCVLLRQYKFVPL